MARYLARNKHARRGSVNSVEATPQKQHQLTSVVTNELTCHAASKASRATCFGWRFGALT